MGAQGAKKLAEAQILSREQKRSYTQIVGLACSYVPHDQHDKSMHCTVPLLDPAYHGQPIWKPTLGGEAWSAAFIIKK